MKSVAVDGSTVAIGTEWALWLSNDSLQTLYFDRVPGLIDLGGCNALAFDEVRAIWSSLYLTRWPLKKDSIWCGTPECASAKDRKDFSLRRICGDQGLCAGNILRIAVVKSGERFGLLLFCFFLILGQEFGLALRLALFFAPKRLERFSSFRDRDFLPPPTCLAAVCLR